MHVDHPLVRKGSVELRGYQERVISQAVQDNTLVVLPTGLGKTMIAAMVAAHRLHVFPESRAVFLAPTKPLAVQHMKSFEKILDIKGMAVLTGEDDTKKRAELWGAARIIFATPQTIENDILRGLKLHDVSLMIFDEAHRAAGDYSYVSIARDYMASAKNPMTLGLTASPSSEREKVGEICASLHIKNIEAMTEKDQDVRQYTQEVKVTWVRVELPDDFGDIHERLKNTYKRQLASLKELGLLESADPRKVSKTRLLMLQSEIRAQLAAGAQAYTAATKAAAAIKVNHAIELLETQGTRALSEYFSRLKAQKSRAVKGLFEDQDMAYAMHLARKMVDAGIEHPKLDALAEIALKNREKKILVFTQYRDSVDSIIERLNDAGLLAHEFIGQAKRGGKAGMTQKKQAEVLDNFRSGKYEILVATSVAEEGLDIPHVDVVVFYEPIPSEIRTIQRRGRTGRHGAGKVFVLIAKDTRDEGYYWSAYHKEKRMGEIVNQMRSDETLTDRPHQQSLITYGLTSGDRVKVIVDSRERNTRVLATLKENCTLSMEHLPVGDYLVSDRVCIERKTIEDFLSSLIDGRLMEQMSEMRRNFEAPVLIIEGGADIYAQRNIHPNAIRGAISSIAVDFGVRIIPSKDEEDTAFYLIALAKREQVENARPVALRGEKKPELMPEKQRFVVESLPNVSAILAERLLKRFGSVEKVMKATVEELMQVEGIGEKKATQIRQVIESDYKA